MIRRSAGISVGLVAVVSVAILAVVALLQNDWVARWAFLRLVSAVNPYEEGTIRIGAVHGTWLTRLELHDVVLTLDDGVPALRVDTIRASYDLRDFLAGEPAFEEVEIAGVAVTVRQLADSTWDLLHPFAGDTAAGEPSGRGLRVSRARISRGRLTASYRAASGDSTLSVEDFELRAANLRVSGGLAVRLDSLGLRILPPDTAPGWIAVDAQGRLAGNRLRLDRLTLRSARSAVSAHGDLPVPGTAGADTVALDFTVSAHPIRAADLRPLVGALDGDGTLELEARLAGSLGRAELRVVGRASEGGVVALDAELEGLLTDRGLGERAAGTPRRSLGARVNGRVRGLDPARLTGDPAHAGVINARVEANLSGPTRDSLDGRMRVVIGESRYGGLATRGLALTGAFTGGRARVDLRGELDGVTLDTRGWARPFDSMPSYDLTGRVARLGRVIPAVLRTGPHAMSPDLAARFGVAGRGVDPRAAQAKAFVALEEPSVESAPPREHGRLEARLEGGEVTARSRLELLGGEVAWETRLTLGDEIAYRVERGRVRGVDLAALSGDSVPSAANATFTLAGRGLDPRTLSLDGRLELEDARYGGYQQVGATARASVRNGDVEVVAELEADSLRFRAQGTYQPYERTPTLRIRDLELRHLNLGRLLLDSALASDLSGTLQLDAQGRDLRALFSGLKATGNGRSPDLQLTARVELVESRFQSYAVSRAGVGLRLERGELAFSGDVRNGEGRAELAGTVLPFADPIRYEVREGRLRELDLKRLLGKGPETRLNGVLEAGAEGRTIGVIRGHGRIDLTASSIGGVGIESARIEARASEGRVGLDGEVTRRSGRATLGGFLEGGEGGTLRRVEARLEVEDSVTGPLGDTLGLRLDLEAGLEAAGEPEARTWAGGLRLGGRIGEVSVDTLRAAFAAARGVVRVDTLHLESNVARAWGGGVVALDTTRAGDRSAARLSLRLLDLSPLAPVVGARRLAADSGWVDAALRSSPDGLEVEVLAGTRALAWDQLGLGVLEARVQGLLRPDRTLAWGEGNARLARMVLLSGVRAAELRLEGAYDGTELSIWGDATIDQRRSARLVARLDPRRDVRRLSFDALHVTLGGERWALRHPTEVDLSHGLAVSDLVLAAPSRSVSVNGVLDPRGEERLEIEVRAVPLEAFADLFGFPELEGEVNGALRFTGTAELPRAVGELTADLSAASRATAGVRIAIDWTGPRFGLDARLAHPDGTGLTVSGILPLTLRFAPASAASDARDSVAGLDLRLTADGVPLEVLRPFLDPKLATVLAGRLTADARAGGTIEAPVLTGDLRVEGGRLRLPTLGVTYDSIGLTSRFEGDRLVLQSVSLGSGGGRLDARGTIGLERLRPGAFDLAFTLDDFRAIQTAAYQATITSELRLTGTSSAPRLSGALRLRDSHVNLAADALPADVERIELGPEDLRVLERRFGYTTRGPESPLDGLYDAAALDLRLRLDRNTWLRHRTNPVIVLELTGELVARKQPGRPLEAEGSIEILPGRSYVEEFGAEFAIKSGEVTLAGRPEDLRFAVTAEHQAGERRGSGSWSEAAVVITLDVQGGPNDVRLTLTSNPAMTDAEIVSYLATGQLPSWTPGGGNEQGGVAAEVALRRVTRNVQTAAAETLPLDVVEVQTDGLRGLTLVAGNYVRPDLYLGLRQPVALTRSTDEATTQNQTTEVEAEYQANRWLLMNLQGGSSSVRFFFKTRYAY